MNNYILINIIIRFIFWEFLLLISLRKHLKFPLLYLSFITFVIYAITFFSSSYLFSLNQNFAAWRFAYSICYTTLLLLVTIISIKCSFFQGLFITLILKNFLDDIYLISKTIQTYFFPDLELYNKNLLLILITMTIIIYPLIHIFIKKFVIPTIKNDDTLSFWKYLWGIPLSFYIIYRISIYPGYTPEIITWNKYEFFLPYIWVIGTTLSYIVILKMVLETIKSIKLREKLQNSDIQISMQKEQYELIKKNIETMRRVRHDFRHHILAINGYIKNKDIEGIKAYLDNYQNSLNFDEIEPICENFALDAIIRHYINISQENNINVTYSITIPHIDKKFESDLCVVLGNLLENSYEACSRQNTIKRFILININSISENSIAISIKNSFEGNISYINNTFMSSKSKREGIGITSVNTIIEKHNGIFKIQYKDNIFQVYILLNI